MKKNIPQKMTMTLFALIVVLMMLPSGRQAKAQYCDFNFIYYWYPYAVINDVEMFNTSESTMEWMNDDTGLPDKNLSNWTLTVPSYTLYDDQERLLKQGNDYELTLRWGVMYYYAQIDVYLDWNGDGYFDADQFVDPYTITSSPEQGWSDGTVGVYPSEHIYERKMYCPYYPNCYWYAYPAGARANPETQLDVIPIKIPKTIPEVETRLRIIARYYYYYNPGPCGVYYMAGYPYGYGEVEDYVVKIAQQLPDTYPAAGNILFNNEKYDGTSRLKNGVMTDFPLPALAFQGPQPTGTKVKYNISGPLPSRQVVYTMLDPVDGSDVITFRTPTQTYYAQSATGSASESINKGTFHPTKGGEYAVNIEVIGVGTGSKVFTVANNYDMSVAGITSPRTNRYPRFFKYLRNTNIAVTCDVQNTGLNPIKKFEVTAKIYDADNDALVSTLPKKVFDSDNDPGLVPLESGQKYEVNFASFQTPFTGEYYIKFEVSYTFDEEEYNNTLPRPDGDKYYFEVQYNDQLAAGDILEPSSGKVLKVNRPYAPVVEFFNQGISDASNINFRMIVKDASGKEVYNESSFLEDLPQGRYNKRLVTFPNMVLLKPGTYTACAWVDYPYDQKHDDDTTCTSFVVDLGIQGTYTVGTLNESSAGWVTDRNFETVGEMMNALYSEGIAGNVEFKFTDAKYVLNGVIPWDFSSRILGVDADHTITLSPANNRIAVRGGVKFELNSQSGKGVLFGHNTEPSNSNAVIKKFGEREYARSAGYITIDGGSQKAFEFELNSSNPVFGAAIYMQRGTEHVTVANVLLTNNSNQIKNSVTLPSVKYGENTGFVYDDDIARNQLGQDVSYSAGVVDRATLIQATEFIGDLRDTLANHDNKIINNDISGFAVGVVDMGLGVLRHDYSSDANVLDTLKSFYNYNNEISGNRIWDAARTGVFIGYSQDSKVSNNLIWDVTAPSGTMASGIEAGGNLSGNSKGYHNLRLSIIGNRITNLTSNTNVTGVRVEQDRTIYETGEKPTIFPRTEERTRIANNFIWGLNVTNGGASRAGIHLLTERGADVTTPDVKTYTSRADDIVNNTIMIGSTGMSNTGMTAGIGVQNTSHTRVLNNAISIVDGNINANTPMAASILLQGNMTDDFINIDRNVYWTGLTTSNLDNANIDLFRYIEQDKAKDVSSYGYRLEYVNLNQIQAATNTQNNSVYGNFLLDQELYQRSGIEPMLYRVKTNPTPLNSLLNNRGETISWLKEDFEGDLRGAAGQRYDIGADEFVGRLHIFDLSPVTILSPRAYRDVTTEFADAEYIMTQAPVNVKINVRNNGSIQQSGTKIYAKIYLEGADGTFGASPVLEKEIETNIPSTNNTTVDFGLADGLDGDDWVPMSYDDLINAGYSSYATNIPIKFMEMQANVTPRYRIDIVVGSDEENSNNIYSKNVRFYLKKTNRNIILSSVNTTSDPMTAGTSATVGKLNYDKLVDGFNKIGYKVEGLGQNPVYDYDKFDRGSWEPRAVDYRLYNFIFYSDGYNSLPTRWEKADIYNYLSAGNERLKNSIVVSSEEWSKLNTDEDFNNILLRSDYVNSNPLGNGNSYEGNSIIGETISKDYVIPITMPMYNDGGTMKPYPNDVAPRPAVVTARNYGSDGKPLQGIAKAAYRYDLSSPLDAQIFGTTTITIGYNIIHNTVDWRNYGDIETVIRGTIDHLERNDASIVPVELTEFNAGQNKKSVVLDWTTASENGSSKFVVERADAEGKTVTGNFVTTGLELTAVGKSTQTNYYGPVVDNNVEYGKTYAYRLRTVDFDGTSELSNEVRIVEILPEGNFNFIGFTANPATTTTKLQFATSENEVSISVVDVNGKEVFKKDQISGTSYELNVSEYPVGAYTVVLRNGTGMQTKQLSVVR